MHWVKADPKWLRDPVVGVSVVCGRGCSGVCLLMGRESNHTLLKTGKRAFSDSQGTGSIRVAPCVCALCCCKARLCNRLFMCCNRSFMCSNKQFTFICCNDCLCSAVKSCSHLATWLTYDLPHPHSNLPCPHSDLPHPHSDHRRG